ncbi:MAG: hypothetical protein O2910_06505 [Proteobacteria bacterium]|nr:hypothetical protein [Pseudomonadota bacterium]
MAVFMAGLAFSVSAAVSSLAGDRLGIPFPFHLTGSTEIFAIMIIVTTLFASVGALIIGVPFHFLLSQFGYVRWWNYSVFTAVESFAFIAIVEFAETGYVSFIRIYLPALAIQGAVMGLGFWFPLRQRENNAH